MSNGDSSIVSTPSRIEGKFKAMVVCWFLGLGCLISWNSMLTIGDYYYQIFPSYHPARVLTLVYQPFALRSMAILSYNEANIDTRKRNMFLFCFSTLCLLLVSHYTSFHFMKLLKHSTRLIFFVAVAVFVGCVSSCWYIFGRCS
ncbi:equilibrative nucleotide transporter 3-like isoform X2 [Salvia splendens]|uniref:equilibrative nucleotide transporter 3-like isoform X2 n=1 Tax=Salvia splendens TaxID=180675 RepID=UPI001C270229|nr:equilibrative nucleotide transporter 3-like isoform X2 [Salvia splendens]